MGQYIRKQQLLHADNRGCIVALHDKQYNVEESGGSLDVHPAPASYTDSTVTWYVSGLSSSTPPVDLYYAIWTDFAGGLLTAGDITHTYVTVTPATGDLHPGNNNCQIIDTVRAGCDPNEISVSPSCIAPASTATQLQYSIGFTNVGNDTAFNIYVMDTLPDNVDAQSLRIVMASNTMNSNIFNDGTHNIAKFDFPQINLLDSAVCPPQCAGAVVFTINTVPGLTMGGSVQNHAGVFFDDNPVVLTNTAVTTVGECTTTKVSNVTAGSGVKIYPNPAADVLTISASVPINAIVMSNLVGQVVYQYVASGNQQTLTKQVDISAAFRQESLPCQDKQY